MSGHPDQLDPPQHPEVPATGPEAPVPPGTEDDGDRDQQ